MTMFGLKLLRVKKIAEVTTLPEKYVEALLRIYSFKMERGGFFLYNEEYNEYFHVEITHDGWYLLSRSNKDFEVGRGLYQTQEKKYLCFEILEISRVERSRICIL